MKSISKIFMLSLALGLTILACQRVPLTGRKQFVGLVSQEQMLALSYQQYQGVMDTSRVLPQTDPRAAMITRVGNRIKTAVENYLIQTNHGELLDGYQWEFRLVDNPQSNAFCMPGGKVMFYSGILPITQTESGVAVVMGHEIAHAVANHGRERMSRALAAQGITQIGAVAAGVATGNQQIMNTAGQVLGITTELGGVLPNSRNQESEADDLGLIFMAMAGYNPQEAVPFWQRMQKASENRQRPPLFLSTHPNDEQRIARLTKNMDKAMQYYNKYGVNAPR